jgi:hypothetical protein
MNDAYDEQLTRFTVTISTDNAAFNPDPAPELARILRAIADRIDRGEDIRMYQTILDVNGNDVGRFAHKPGWYQ